MTSAEPNDSCIRFPIVGLGASAGGLEAFKRFLSTVAPGTGMAFVLIQHLDPDRHSLMAELLGKSAVIPVFEIADGMKVEPDTVYMIPPNAFVEISNGAFVLNQPVEEHGVRLPIDAFFRSLAENYGRRSIAVILSGTGSDGSQGIKDVKESGGLVVAQSPKTATHTGMPKSAIQTGMVDFILSPEEMAEELVQYSRHPHAHGDEGSRELEDNDRNNVQQIIALLRARTEYNFNAYKPGTLIRRIERRLSLNQLTDLREYVKLLRSDPDEVQQLFRDLLINVTSFFRDPEVWDQLEKAVLPSLVSGCHRDRPIRIWVPACSTGEEAYSIAISLVEAFGSAKKPVHAQIYATDVDEEAIDIARGATYPLSIASDIPDTRLAHYFTEEDAGYTVRKSLREMVVFAVQNLVDDPPFSNLDLISCRNVLIYLEPEIQKTAIEVVAFALKTNGYLVLGTSESISRTSELFRIVSKPKRIFQKIKTAPSIARQANLQIPQSDMASGSKKDKSSKRESVDAPKFDAGEVTRRNLLTRYCPSAVLINENFDVLYFHGQVRRFLDYPSGEPTRNLLSLCASGLKTKLRVALRDVESAGQAVSKVARQVQLPDTKANVRIDVEGLASDPSPIQNSPPSQRPELFLVTFVEEPVTTRAREEKEDQSVVTQLEFELQAMREDLQSTIEELEASNEELKASNEEAMSMNEELQSTNEELETSREELQSLNEELSTVNSQLEDKVRELEGANNDLQNLLSSTDIATIFLDRKFRVRRFTPAIRRLVRLIPEDIGRSFNDIAQRFQDEELLNDARKVLENLIPNEREITDGNENFFIRRILPYRTHDDRIEGVVITFTDVTPIRQQAGILEIRARQQAATAELGRLALSGGSMSEISNFICHSISTVLNVPLTKILKLLPSGEDLVLVDGVGWEKAEIGKSKVSAGRHSQAGYTLESENPIVTENLEAESRFQGPELLLEHGVVSGMSVIIGSPDKPWGVLGAHSRESRVFSIDDINFLQSMANTLYEALSKKAVEDSLRDSETRYKLVNDSLPVLIAYCSKDLRYEYCNARYEEWFSVSREQIIGKSVRDFIGEDAFRKVKPYIDRCLAGEQVALEEELKYEHGHTRQVRIDYIPHSTGGEVAGYYAMIQDYSERHRFEVNLKESERRLALALEAGKMGIFETDERAGRVSFDDRIAQLFHVTDQSRKCSMDEIWDRVFEEDRATLKEQLDLAFRGDGRFSAQFRVINPGGEPRWIEGTGTVIKNRAGVPTALVGLNYEITEKKLWEDELSKSNLDLRDLADRRAAELQLLTENVPAVFAYIDKDLRYRFVNAAFRKLLCLPKSDLEEAPVEDSLAGASYDELHPKIELALQGEAQQFEFVLNAAEDGVRILRAQCFPRKERDSSINGVFFLADDITEERRLQQEVLEASEREKERIGQDLHDSICQELSGIGMLTKVLADDLSGKGSPHDIAAGELVEKINQVTQKSRLLARGLSPVALESRNLFQALQEFTASTNNLHPNVNCSLIFEDENVDLDEFVATQIFFIAREAVFNALRHSGCSSIQVSVSTAIDALLLKICDDGKGKSRSDRDGLGIRSMQYRARTVGGNLKIQSENQNGLTVTCVVPIDSQE